MASPEIKLPMDPDISEETSIDQDVEKSQEVVNRYPSSSADSLVVYHYLDFDTELPSPTSLQDHSSHQPEPPNLRNLGSPFEWSETRKNLITWLSCAVTVCTAYTAGSYAAAADQLMEKWYHHIHHGFLNSSHGTGAIL